MKKILLSCLAFLAVIVFISILLPTPQSMQNTNGMPWEIERDETGQTRVFGLSPRVSTLYEAIARFGSDMELAIIVAANVPRGEEEKDAALEAYFQRVTLGFVTARMILTLDAQPQTIVSMLERSGKAEIMRNGSRKLKLRPEDADFAKTLPIVAITLVPNADLDAETIVSRFGTPAAVIPEGETLQHYLYPDKGLHIVLDSKGKEILQYVAPADFEHRIMRPLKPEEHQ